MNVCLTIDVESYSGDYGRDVYGDGLGLPFILDTCRQCGVAATFFVEALGVTRWGPDGVRRICADLAAAGQDIQLHVHPVVARLEWLDDRNDVLWMHGADVQERLIDLGRELLRDCSGRYVSAFRAGDFAANEGTLSAMERLGIRIGSNRNLDTKCSTRSQVNAAFPVRNDVSRRGGVTDVPTSCLRSALPFLDGKYRHLQICALGAGEMIDALERMGRAGYACATILTHPGEYFRVSRGKVVPVAKNCRRLSRVVSFVANHPGMQFRTVDECASTDGLPERSPPELRLNLFRSLLRVWEQALDRVRT